MAERRSRRKSFKNRPKPRSERLQSGLSLIPSLFTIGNMFCAYFSVISTFKGNYDYAAMAIGVGVVLDGLDGRIARLTQTSSEFGVQLDSIADVLTFGIAPAVLAFVWGQNHIAGLGATGAAALQDFRGGVELYATEHLRQWSWIVTFIFMMCGGWRLARFNVQSQTPLDPGSKRNFVGLPIPAGAGLIAAFVHFFKSPLVEVIPAMFWYLLVLLIGFLMVSTIRYPSFKELHFMNRGSRLTLLLTASLIGSIYFYSEVMLLLISVVYVSSGLVMQTMRRFGGPAAPALGEPAHGNIKT
jgi:CDP-diacylglycerol---serine O-phosphatidyltransferase